MNGVFTIFLWPLNPNATLTLMESMYMIFKKIRKFQEMTKYIPVYVVVPGDIYWQTYFFGAFFFAALLFCDYILMKNKSQNIFLTNDKTQILEKQ